MRQLNMYDFHKIKEETCENYFCHSEFQRGCKNLLPNIRRKTGPVLDNEGKVTGSSEKTKISRAELDKSISELKERIRLLEEKDKENEQIRRKMK